MPSIHLTTFIAAPIERIFDLSRSINLHKVATAATGEEAIAGTITGLISKNETVTWRAKHLFKKRTFTSKITAMEAPVYFCDEMQQGDFKSFKHEHHFKQVGNGVIMIDLVDFESPYGAAGRFVNKYYLTRYLEKMLQHRNNVIKEYAETDKWKLVLN